MKRQSPPAKVKSKKNLEAQDKKRFDDGHERRLKKLSQERQSQLVQHLQEKQKEVRQERVQIKKDMRDGIEPMYQDALRAYKAKDYAKAEEIFFEIHQLLPDYKQTEDYLGRMGSRLEPRPPPFPKSVRQDQRRQVVSDALDKM